MEFQIHTVFPAELMTEWNQLLAESSVHVPFLRHEYLHAWWSTHGGGEWPQDARLLIITARENQQLIGIAPLFYVPDWQGKACLMLLGSIEISDYLDVLVKPENLQDFIEGLLKFLTQPHAEIPNWQRLDLYNLLDSSPTLPALEAAARLMQLPCEVEQLQHSPYIPLTGDWETYLAGIDKKQRHEIRRKMRRAQESEAAVRWYLVSDPSTVDSEIQAFIELMEQDPDKARFLTPAMREQMKITVRCAFESGCLHLAFLEIDGNKAAGYLSFDYLNRIWVYNSGIDRAFIEYSPGWVLLGELLKWSNENKRSAFDFMRGDEEYKYRFGAIDRFVMRAKIEKEG